MGGAAILIRGLCLSVVLTGCDASERLHLDFASASALAEVLFVEHGEERSAYAVSLDTGIDVPLVFRGSDRPRLHALLFAHSLEELGLEPGPIDSEPASPFPSRLAAVSARYFVRDVSLDDAGDWVQSSTTSAPDFVLRKMIDGPDALACLERGGCFAHDPEDARVCLSACPEPVAPEPPREPELPRIDCPLGWQAVPSELGVTWCEPWGADAPPCDAGLVRFPGERACAELGPPCPPDGWPGDLPPGTRTIYVDPEAAPGQDGGAKERALRSIDEALAVAGDGAVLALSEGRHAALGATLDRKVTLVGACAAATTIEVLAEVTSEVEIRSSAIHSGVLTVTGTGTLALREAVLGAVLDISARATLERVQLVGAGEIFNAGTLEARSIEVRTTGRFLESSGVAVLEELAVYDGTGTAIEASGELEVRRALVERRRLLTAEGGVIVADVVARDAPGVMEVSAGDLEVRRVRFESDWIVVALTGGTAVMEDAIIVSSSMNGAGVGCSGCELHLVRALMEIRSEGTVGITVDGSPNARVTIDDVWLKGSGPEGALERGGISMGRGSLSRHLELNQVLLEGLRVPIYLGAGARLNDVRAIGGHAGITVVSEAGVAPGPDISGARVEIAGEGACGYGLFAGGGTTTDLESVAVRGCVEGAIAEADGVLRLSTFALDENETGLRLFRNVDQIADVEYEVELADGSIGDNRCGVTYTPLAGPFDFKRVAARVRFERNGANVAAVVAGSEGHCPAAP